jgi:hypothetical protein
MAVNQRHVKKLRCRLDSLPANPARDFRRLPAKEAAHACRNEQARECFEFALALLRESWIAESGQNARGAERVIADVKWGLRLIAAVFAKEGR